MLTRTIRPSDAGGKDLGIFLPMANGGWILSSNTPPLDGSYAMNRDIALLADQFCRAWQRRIDAKLEGAA